MKEARENFAIEILSKTLVEVVRRINQSRFNKLLLRLFKYNLPFYLKINKIGKYTKMSITQHMCVKNMSQRQLSLLIMTQW